MKIPSIQDVEHSVGGRPRMENPKVRISFYISSTEAQQLQNYAEKASVSVSLFVRLIIKRHFDELYEKQ